MQNKSATPRRPDKSSEREQSGPFSDVRTVAIDSIVVPPRRIRRDLGDVDALAASLQLHGQLAPVIVYQVGDEYRLIAGERRLEATRRMYEARLKSGEMEPDAPRTIGVVVRTLLPGENPRELELAENAQRRELNDDEEADALIRLVREDGHEMREVAAIAGRSLAYVSKRVRMFEDSSLRAALTDGRIAPAQAEELLILTEQKRSEMLQLALDSGWGSEEIREAIQVDAGRSREAGKGAPLYSVDASVSPPVGDDDDDYVSDDDEADDDSSSEQSRFRTEIAGPGIVINRPRDLTRRIAELNAILRDLRPFQLKAGDDRALRQLWVTMRQLAQAPRVPVPARFPSLVEAESLARRR
jgi:ParB family chromosome partitioning protein